MEKETIHRDRRSPRDGCAEKRMIFGHIARTCRGERARLNAREGLGALSAGRAGKMAARWHELVGTLERTQVA